MSLKSKIAFALVALFLFSSFAGVGMARAAIFEGSVPDQNNPKSVGYCLRNPDADTCKGIDCLGKDSTNPLCLSEAQEGTGLVKTALTGTGITHTETVGQLIVKYVNFVLPYLALAAFVAFVVAGFMYVTAYGSEDQVGKAKKIMTWAVIGLIIVILSYAIVQFLTSSLVTQLQG